MIKMLQTRFRINVSANLRLRRCCKRRRHLIHRRRVSCGISKAVGITSERSRTPELKSARTLNLSASLANAVALMVLAGRFKAARRLLHSASPSIAQLALRHHFQQFGLKPLLLLAHSGASKIPASAVRLLTPSATETRTIRDEEGNTLLHLLIRRERYEDALKLIPLLKTMMEVTNYLGRTPLHLAVLSRNVAVVDKLLASGANINATSTKSGLTPLHFAVLDSDNVAVIQRLLREPQIQVNARATGGRTALAIAWNSQNEKIKQILMMAGAVRMYGPNEEDTYSESDEDSEMDSEDEFENTTVKYPNCDTLAGM